MSFSELGLSAEILRAVTEKGYTEPTPIQLQAIPLILQGCDIMGAAQTGTGKTAGFTLPLLNRLQPLANTSASPARHPVRALILTPTRELAAQVEDSVKLYGKYLPLKSAVVYGGININPQIELLKSGVEILVATPGRLLDHVHQRSVNLSQVQILVLDEADRMLDMGFMPDIRRILLLLPAQRQNLMFSATFSDEIKKLANTILKNPVMVEVARRNAPAELVRQLVYLVPQERKQALLAHLIKSENLQQVLVFGRTKHGASRLAQQLVRSGIAATAIHGDKTQPQRTQALEDFKAGVVRVLVATDVAARGLDIEELPHVINYELPHVPEDYVHRIGRTGRAGAEGDAISLVCDEEVRLLKEIEQLLKREIPRKTAEGFEADAPAASPLRAAAPRPARAHSAARSQREPDTERAAPPRHAREPRKNETMSPEFKQFIEQPYQPSTPSPASDPSSPQPNTHRKRTEREIPVLLGGSGRRTQN